jgi:hypothetical protein
MRHSCWLLLCSKASITAGKKNPQPWQWEVGERTWTVVLVVFGIQCSKVLIHERLLFSQRFLMRNSGFKDLSQKMAWGPSPRLSYYCAK